VRERPGPVLAVVLLGSALGVAAFFGLGYRFGPAEATPTTLATTTTTTSAGSSTVTSSPAAGGGGPTTTTTTVPVRDPDTVPGWTVGQNWGSVRGLTMFRGNPTRTFHGSGPIASPPEVAWRYPESAMCASSSVGGESRVWCGMGWTGQPVIYEREDGGTEVIFGAYDRAVHFVDGDTGQALRPRFVTGDLVKGSVTLDPDGYPLVYFGSRDNKLRIVAFDRDTPTELWSLDANEVRGVWNNDWDGNPVIVDDILYEGGENSWFFAYQLNRGYDAAGEVIVDPERLLAMPGYDDLLLSRSGRNVSIESSPAVYEQRVYFTNSGGRVVGLDVSDIRNGNAPIVFDYWAGGDIDATPVIDEDGFLYIAIEYEPSTATSASLARNREVGQLIKLDPYTDGDPLMWGIDLTQAGADTGIWATPAIYRGHLYVPTHHGELLAVDMQTGDIVWTDQVGWHTWSSPAIVDGSLIQATCLGDIRSYSLANPARPALEWSVSLGQSCLEATPAIWNGTIYIGSRDGFIRALR
jgi:hypothetical protein